MFWGDATSHMVHAYVRVRRGSSVREVQVRRAIPIRRSANDNQQISALDLLLGADGQTLDSSADRAGD